MKHPSTLSGILPVLPTPFHDDGSIDPVGMGRVTEFALNCGVHGVVYPGFASEVEALEPAERRALLGVVVDRVGGKVPIVAGASADTVQEAIARCREALELDIEMVMIQSPKAVGSQPAEVSRFYSSIAAAVPGISIVLQNAPAPRGSDLSSATILEVMAAAPAIRFIKEESLPSGPPISALLASGKFGIDSTHGVIGGGGARYIIDELNRGACAAMPAVEFAEIHVALFDAYRAGDFERARMLYQRSLPLLVIQALSRMRFTKHVLVRRGVLANDVVRVAIPPLDDHDRHEIGAWLDDVAPLLATAARPVH